MMLNAFIVMFCRVTTILIFGMSFIGKLSNIPSFQEAVTNFGILSPKLSRSAAWIFLAGEFVVIVLAIRGENALFAGFVLAAFLLTIFSIALGIALIRRLQVPCNCFGRTEKPISPYDLVRNGSFIVCNLLGASVFWTTNEHLAALDTANVILTGLMGAVFVMILTNLSEIIQLYNQPATLR